MVKKLGVLVVLLLCVSFASAAEDYCDTFFDTPEKIGAANNLCAKRLTAITGKTLTADVKGYTCYGIYKGIPLTSVNDYVDELFGNPYIAKEDHCPTTTGNFVSSLFNSPADKATLIKCIDDSKGKNFGKLYKVDCKVSEPECSDTKACATGKTCTAGKCVVPQKVDFCSSFPSKPYLKVTDAISVCNVRLQKMNVKYDYSNVDTTLCVGLYKGTTIVSDYGDFGSINIDEDNNGLVSAGWSGTCSNEQKNNAKDWNNENPTTLDAAKRCVEEDKKTDPLYLASCEPITKADGDFDGDGKVDKTKDVASIKSKVKEFVSYIKSLKGKDSLGKEIHKYLRKIK
jgi:hypothetical protein